MLLRSPLSFHPSATFGRKSGRHCRAGAGHSQPHEDGVGEFLDVEAESPGSGSLFDRGLQQAEAFARVAVACAGIEVDAQRLIGFGKPEVTETRG
jgi:hypothetical protein